MWRGAGQIMNRPRYETERDRANERIVAEALRERGYELMKLNPTYRLDCAIIKDGQPRGFVEIKARTFGMNRFSTALINLHKVIAARQLSFETNLPSYMVVLYQDALARISFAEDFELGVFEGRNDRDDPMDRDLVAHFPISRFMIVSQR